MKRLFDRDYNFVQFLSFLTFSITLFYIVVFFSLKLFLAAYLTLPFSILYLVALFLALSHRKILNKMAEVMIVFTGYSSILVFSQFFPVEAGLYLFLIFELIISYAIMKPSKVIHYVLLSAITTIIFIVIYTGVLDFNFISKVQLSHAIIDATLIFSFAFSTLSVGIASWYYNRIIQKSTVALENSIVELQQSKEQLQKTYGDLKSSKSAAEELARQSAYATLTRGIAHEIRNPLQMLYGRAELVLEDLDDRESVEKFAHVIMRNIQRLRKLLTSMLAYGVSTDRDQEVFVINKILEDIYELSQHKCVEYGLNIILKTHDPVRVVGNKTFIFQAILNIVVNAIQYTSRSGTVTLSMKTKTYEDKDGITREGVEVKISDTGSGMTEEELKEIFVPYYTTKKTKENTGLGLSMVFKTIMENNGMIDVSSTKGVGTTFRVCLPRE